MRFLDAHGIGAGGEIVASPIGEGHSNVTYLIERDSNSARAEVVLRRPPRPPLPPSAHDVLREARLLRRSPPRPRACRRCSRSATTRR